MFSLSFSIAYSCFNYGKGSTRLKARDRQHACAGKRQCSSLGSSKGGQKGHAINRKQERKDGSGQPVAVLKLDVRRGEC